MRITNIIILIFLLSAFAIGISMQEQDFSKLHDSIDNASNIIQNINLTYPSSESSKIPNMEGFYLILEKYIQFIGTLFFEVLRAGIQFGYDNPNYFEAANIIYIAKLICILLIISLLIKPVMYLGIFIIMGIIFIKDKIKKKKDKKFVNKK